MEKELKKFLIFFLLAILLFQAGSVFAFEIKYPPLPGAPPPTPGNLPSYVQYIFSLSLMVISIICLGVIVYGGVLYLVAGGKPAVLVSARTWIFSGLVGFLILLSSYLILVTINPQLSILHIEVEPTPPIECGNGLCEAGETYQNCPQDCPETPTPGIATSTYIQLPTETSIKRILCQEYLCKEELPTSTKAIRCKREPEPQQELERCFCKKVEIDEKYISCEIHREDTEATSTSLLDAILIVSECFREQSEIFNAALKTLAEDLQTLAEQCECNSCPDCICPDTECSNCQCVDDCESCCCPCEGECPCEKCLEVNPGADPCPSRGAINAKRQEIQDFLDSIEYHDYQELEIEIERLRCELLDELVKLKKLDLLMRSCGAQIDVLQAKSHYEILAEIEEAGKIKYYEIEIKKLAEWEMAEIFDPPARVVDAPVTFYCQETEDWQEIEETASLYLINKYLPQFEIDKTCLELSAQSCIPDF